MLRCSGFFGERMSSGRKSSLTHFSKVKLRHTTGRGEALAVEN